MPAGAACVVAVIGGVAALAVVAVIAAVIQEHRRTAAERRLIRDVMAANAPLWRANLTVADTPEQPAAATPDGGRRRIVLGPDVRPPSPSGLSTYQRTAAS